MGPARGVATVVEAGAGGGARRAVGPVLATRTDRAPARAARVRGKARLVASTAPIGPAALATARRDPDPRHRGREDAATGLAGRPVRRGEPAARRLDRPCRRMACGLLSLVSVVAATGLGQALLGPTAQRPPAGPPRSGSSPTCCDRAAAWSSAGTIREHGRSPRGPTRAARPVRPGRVLAGTGPSAGTARAQQRPLLAWPGGQKVPGEVLPSSVIVPLRASITARSTWTPAPQPASAARPSTNAGRWIGRSGDG